MENVWAKNYQPGVPTTIDPDKYASINELFLEACHNFKSKPALSNMGTRLSYEKVEQLSRDLAAYFQQVLQLKKGDRIALMMPNLMQYPIALFAAFRAGLVIVNINPLYTADELTYQINDSGADNIVILANFAHTLEKALPNTKIKNIIITEIGDLFPQPKRFIVNSVVKYIKKMVPSFRLPNTVTFKDALHKGQQQQLQPVEIVNSDIAFLQYTGGTTGVAKGAVLTHRNMLANVTQAYAWVQETCKEGCEIMVTPLPLYHIFSLTANLLTFLYLGACNILITNPRDIKNFIKEIKDEKFSGITGVNTLFNAMLHHPDFKKIDFSRLKIALGGGMAVQQYVAEQWHKATGQPLMEGYGLTETSPVISITPLNEASFTGSIGLPVPSTEISIRDDDDNELGFNEPGELCVRGPQVMQGYWQKPEETAKVLSEDGWLRTGDIATIDEKGYIYIVDRKKDMILVSGFNVYPNEVEDVITRHPGVLEAGVVGVMNNESGEKVKAFIVKKDPEITTDEIIKHCRNHLTAYKVPKLIEFCDDLPKTNVGKILRRELREAS